MAHMGPQKPALAVASGEGWQMAQADLEVNDAHDPLQPPHARG
jgi:hypothetical protein